MGSHRQSVYVKKRLDCRNGCACCASATETAKLTWSHFCGVSVTPCAWCSLIFIIHYGLHVTVNLRTFFVYFAVFFNIYNGINVDDVAFLLQYKYYTVFLFVCKVVQSVLSQLLSFIHDTDTLFHEFLNHP